MWGPNVRKNRHRCIAAWSPAAGSPLQAFRLPLGAAVVAGYGVGPNINAEEARSLTSLQERLAEHIEKSEAYLQNPGAFEQQG